MGIQEGEVSVLHVDDDPDITDVTSIFLEREEDRLGVHTATSPDEGLSALTDHDVDCIVSDYEMPRTDGIEFLQTVRDTRPDLPFILFTGKGSEEVASDAISAGATDYLQKRSGTDQYALLANRVLNAVEQYRSELRLGKTQEEYAAVFENAQNALLLLEVEDGEFRYQRCNPRAVEVGGYDETEIIGRTPREVLGVENGEKVVEAFQACVERGTAVEYTVSLDLPVGGVIHECQATPVTSDGEVEQLVVSFDDVTEQRRNQRALDALEELFFVVGADRRLQRWNDRTAEVTGYSAEELDGMAVAEFFPEAERATVVDALETALTGDRAPVEADLLTADGRRIPYEFTGARLTDENGHTTGIVGIGHDLTERRRREQRFQALVEESNDIISILDTEGTYQYQSPSIERILGYDPEETIGDTVWGYIHPDDRDALRETFERWVDDPDGAGQVEYRARHADGSWRWMAARGNNQLDNPAIEGFVANSRDITDRRERERELAAVKGQYQTLVENFPDGAVYLFDDEFSYVQAGGQELTAVGLSSDEVEGATPHELFPEDVADETVRHYRDALDGNAVTYEQEYGGERYRIEALPVRGDDGEIIYGMAVSRNVTEQVEQRRELTRQNERLDEFASIVSHDLRSPLGVAEGRLELARDSRESTHLAEAAEAIDRSQALIDDLLTLAREGERANELESVALADVAERSWQTVATEEAVLANEASQVVRADRSRLRELFENLYRNAVEHGSTSPPSDAREDAVEHGSTSPPSDAREDAVEHDGVDVTVRVDGMDGGFYVADTGAGIPEAARDRIFESGYSTTEEGTGFGLTIIEAVADAHGWELTVTDSEQGGARFEFTGVETAD